MPKILKNIKHQIHAITLRFKRKVRFIEWKKLWHKFKWPAIIFLCLLILFGLFLWVRQLPPRAPQFKKSQIGDYIYEAKNKVFQAKFGIREQKPLVTFNVGSNKSVTLSYQNSNISQPTLDINGRDLTFKDVETNMDIQYKTLANGIKEEIVLHQARQKEANANVFLFAGNFQGAYPKEIIKGISGTVFYDSDNNYLFNFEKPFAIDAAGNRTDNVSIQIENKNDSQLPVIKSSIDGENPYVIRLTVDESWLNDPARVYPIIIDPTIIHDESSEFSTGQLDGTKDTGSGSSPSLESFYREYRPDMNTVGLWHMNETSGSSVIDSSSTSSDGTATGTSIIDGLISKGRYFDGSSYIATSLDAEANQLLATSGASWSVETWFNTASTSGTLVGRSGGTGTSATFELWVDSSGYLAVILRGTNNVISSIGTVNDGKWHHTAITWDGSIAKAYLDGDLVSTLSVGTAAVQTYTIYLGATANGGNTLYAGSLDEVRISNIARTPEEIKAAVYIHSSAVYTSDVINLTSVSAWNSLGWLVNGTATGDGETPASSTGLVAQWNFNESSGTTAVSGGSCGTSCNGTLTNFASTGSQDEAVGTGWTYNNRRWGTGALMFDGSDDHVTIPDNSDLDITGSLTVSSWVKLRGTSTTNYGGVNKYANNTSYPAQRAYGFVFLANTTSPAVYISADGSTALVYSSSTNISLDEWHQITFTYEPSTAINIYIDGKLDTTSTTSVPASLFNSSAPLWIGTHYDNTVSTRFSKSIYDAVQIYSRTLTSSEILSNYNSSRVEFQTRVGSSTDANDGTWEAWKPFASELAITSLDSDSVNWDWDNTSTYMPKSKSDDSVVKSEGSGSLKINVGKTQVDANTLGLWHLDETTGTGTYLKDSTATAYHLTPTGTTSTDGFFDKARVFNGSSDYIDLGNNHYTNTDFASGTLETWIQKPQSRAISDTIFSFEGYVTLTVDTTGVVACCTDGVCNTAVGITVVDDDKWHHIACAWSTSSYTNIYVDGLLDGTSTPASSPDLDNTSRGQRIGSSYSGTNFFEGTIDEIKISSTALSEEEIAENYRAGRDHRISKIISSANLSSSNKVPFWIATDRLGTFSQLIVGESAYANSEPDANTVGLWHLDDYRYADDSGNSNNGIHTYNGIQYGIQSSNLTLTANQWNGAANNGEMDVTCTGGDAACYIVNIDGTTISTPSINYGVAMLEATSADAFVMYSPSLTGQGITPYTNNSNNFITIRWTGSLWQYDNNSAWVTFTPISSNIIIASLTEGTTVTNLMQLDYHPIIIQGSIGNGRYFNGSTNKIITDLTLPSSTLTYSAWVYPTLITDDYDGIVGDWWYSAAGVGEQLSLGLNLGKPYARLALDATYIDLVAPDALIANQWSHIVVVYDKTNSTLFLYANGALVASSSTSTIGSGIHAQPIQIGALRATSGATDSRFFNGSIDEVRIDTIARTSEEIRQAYEIGARVHDITIDFKANLDAGNLIAGSGDLSFTVDETAYGSTYAANHLFLGDKIIVKENYDGTEYIAQGTVNAVNFNTGAVTVVSWDSGSTFPSGGFTVNATVFKWQREYFDLTGSLSTQRDAITRLTYRITDGSMGANIWLDDIKSSTNYLNNPLGSTITSSIGNQYFQYRAIFSQNDVSAPSAALTSVTLDYTPNYAPNTPSLDLPINTATGQSLFPTLKTTATDDDSDYLRYKIQLCTDVAMTTNCQTFDQTSSQTGWSGQDTQTNTAYASGTQASYTVQTTLLANTTYYWRSYAIDPAGTNTWSSTQATPYSFTTGSAVSPASNCILQLNTEHTQILLTWIDNADNEDYYEVQRSLDGAAWTVLQTTLAANTVSLTDGSVANGHTYSYRVAPYMTSGPVYASWCTTSTLSVGTGRFSLEGFKATGLRFD